MLELTVASSDCLWTSGILQAFDPWWYNKALVLFLKKKTTDFVFMPSEKNYSPQFLFVILITVIYPSVLWKFSLSSLDFGRNYSIVDFPQNLMKTPDVPWAGGTMLIHGGCQGNIYRCHAHSCSNSHSVPHVAPFFK